jgi:hypothetical protein
VVAEVLAFAGELSPGAEGGLLSDLVGVVEVLRGVGSRVTIDDNVCSTLANASSRGITPASLA